MFRKHEIADNQVLTGVPAKVLPADKYYVKLVQTKHFQYLPPKVNDGSPLDFKDFLNKWGGEWMWEGLRLNEKPEWVAECLQNGMLVCVTDGSYIKKSALDLCSAGWGLACRRTRRYIAGTLVKRSP